MEKLEKKINQIITEVIEEVAEQYLKILIEHIEKYVYEPKEPRQYKRTNQFLYSFEKLSKAKNTMNEIIQEIYFNSSNLIYKKQDSDIWQHGVEGSNYTNKMAEILNSETLNKQYSQIKGALNVGNKGLYWDEFLKYIDNNLIKDIKMSFSKKGVMLK